MPNFIAMLEDYVNSVIGFHDFHLDALYFSKKHLVLKISAESRNSTLYSYILKVKPNQYVQPIICALNKVIWSKSEFKIKNYFLTIDLIRYEYEIMNFIENYRESDYLQPTMVFNSSFTAYLDIIPPDFTPTFFKIPKIIKKNEEYLIIEYIKGQSLSELAYSLESLDISIFYQVGEALSELNHKWKIDLVDCNLRNIIVSENPDHINREISNELFIKKSQNYTIHFVDFEDAIKLNLEAQSKDFYRFIAHLLTINGGILDFDMKHSMIKISQIDRALDAFISSYHELYSSLTNNNDVPYRKSILLEELQLIVKRRNIPIDKAKLLTSLKQIKSLDSLK